MNLWDILILLAVGAAAVFGVFRIRKRKQAGNSCCSCSCETCSLCRNKPE